MAHGTATAVLVALGIAVAGAAGAAPKEKDPKAVARAKLLEGAELLSQGEYEDALTRFQEAYARVPSAKIFYNYGLAYRGLGRYAEAITSFDRFLDEAKDATPDKRSDAEHRRAELLKKVATLEVSSEVEGAEIVIDGRSYGKTPRATPIYLDSGPHLLALRKGGAQQVQQIAAERGQKQTVVMNLTSTTVPPPLVAGPVAPPPSAPVAPLGSAPASDNAPPAADTAAWSPLRIAAWATAAGAAAFLVGGTVEMVAASSKLDEFGRTKADNDPSKSCGTELMSYGGANCLRLHQDWSRAHTIGLVGLVGGAALAATSATLFILSARRAGAGERLACAPTAAWAGLTCGGRF
jgi:hypothetical protein